MYSRVNHPQEVTKEVKFKGKVYGLSCSCACRCSNTLFKPKADMSECEAKWQNNEWGKFPCKSLGGGVLLGH